MFPAIQVCLIHAGPGLCGRLQLCLTSRRHCWQSGQLAVASADLGNSSASVSESVASFVSIDRSVIVAPVIFCPNSSSRFQDRTFQKIGRIFYLFTAKAADKARVFRGARAPSRAVVGA